MIHHLLLLLAALSQDPGELRPMEELGLRVAPGFKVSLFADAAIANDLYSMTLDAKGRVVVSSQGWIKTLFDTDGDGKADKAVTFAATGSGAMGLCFDGNDLICSSDNALWRHRDADGDGVADGPPEKLATFSSGEHGHHAMRKGPDGCWYLIAGNDARVGRQHVTFATSPVRNPETGAIVRFSPDFKSSEVIAHGFRNPYDFDFNGAGDLFTYDSDCERDYLLPWYTPTRIYHVGYGQHHGWRLTGYQRSFANQDFYADTVDLLWAVGRGSPTGVVCYRHDLFPERYRGGVFALDWTFGKVWFLPLTPQGASYGTKAEIFLEPSGSDGFAPTDAAVAPDGALLLSIGGRRTRGAVYRIEPLAKPRARPALPWVRDILAFPQPLDAWSRAEWEPLARTLGAEAIAAALGEKETTSAERMRALELLTDLFNGVPLEDALRAARRPEPEVRARVAWALGRRPCEGFGKILLTLAEDDSPRVRVAALDALADRAAKFDPETLAAPILSNLGHPEKRVRQAAARVAAAASLPPAKSGSLAMSSSAFARSLVAPRHASDAATLSLALAALEAAANAEERLPALRLIVVGLGDTNLAKPPVEVLSNYTVAGEPAPEDRTRILGLVRPLFPSGDPRLDAELGRLFAMLEDDDAALPARIAAALTPESSATQDIHTLIVLCRLRGAWPEGHAARLADALLSLGKKLGGGELRTKQAWGSRTAEIAALLDRRDPRFAAELLKHPRLVDPGHVGIAAALGGDSRSAAARLFLAAVGKDASFAWSEPLLGLLSPLPRAEFLPPLRTQWSNFGLRDSIVLHLAQAPDVQDREKFLTGLESANRQVLLASLAAIEALPPDGTPATLVPLLRLLRRLTLDATARELRQRLLALIARQSGRAPWEIRETESGPTVLRKAYEPVFAAFESLKKELESGGAVDVTTLLKSVPWDDSSAPRGQEIFRARGCQTCHAVQGALGPNLAGAANRFSREDLFEAIANPSRDVAPLYRTTLFQMKDGNVHTGIVAFDSADGYLVQTGATTTVRINTPDIAGQRPGSLSLMPNGLLDGLKPGDLADLYAYLRSLTK